MVELNGAYSNPRARDELWRLYDLKRELLSRKRAPKKPDKRVLPRTRVPLLSTITQVLELANGPMSVKDIHRACEELLGRPVSYRSLKASLSAHRGINGRFYRVGYGKYRLRG